MRVLLIFALLLTLAAAQSTNTSANSTCIQCEKLYTLTASNLWIVNNSTSLTACQNFSYASGGVTLPNGDLLVADAGVRSIIYVPANCSANYSFTVVANDDANLSWLYPRDLAFDNNTNILYVSTSLPDPLWMTYALPRQRLARELHVYAIQLNSNYGFTGAYSILSAGAGNGIDISSLRVVNSSLWGIRAGKYITQWVNGYWQDYLGPNNQFQLSSFFVGLAGLDFDFQRCGYLAAAAPADGNFLTCTSNSNVASCADHCSSTLFGSYNNSVYGTNTNSTNNATTITQQNPLNLLPFSNPGCIDQPEYVFSVNGSSVNASDIGSNLQKCDNLALPSSVLIDCDCSLIVGTFGNRVLYRYDFNGLNSTSGLFAPVQTVANVGAPIVKVLRFTPASCSSTNFTPAPTPAPSTTPEPSATPAPSITPEPSATPEPFNVTSAPTPAPSTTAAPTTAPAPTTTPAPSATPEPTAAPSTLLARIRRML